MPKAKKSTKPSKLRAKLTEQNLLIVLVVVLLVCVGVLLFKERSTTELTEPVTVEQSADE